MKNILWNMKETILCGILLIIGALMSNNLVLLLAIIVGGYHQTKEGLIDTFENRHLNVELLMILSAVGACLIGFFEEGAVLIFIFSLSGALEDFTLDQSQREIRKMMANQPSVATRLLSNGSTETVSVEMLAVDDRIIVAMGETFPIDAVILEGRSSIEEAAITGESLPKEKTVGESVFGGTLNISHPLTLRVSTNVNDTLIQKIVRMVEEAQQFPSKAARFIDKLEDIYARIILISVVLVIAIPVLFMAVPFVDAFYKGMILLVVASPCALIASVTPATLSAISNGARRGILVKGGVHFENLMDVKAVAFDKTGTLTYGLPSLSESYFIADGAIHAAAIIALENYSSHPLAGAIVSGLSHEFAIVSSESAQSVEEKPGYGVKGIYAGKEYRVGNRDFMTQVNQEMDNHATQWSAHGMSLVYVECDAQLVAVLGLSDQLRSESGALVSWLSANDIATVMITGDNEETAQHIASQIGITRVIASCLPDQKANIVRELELEYGSVLMIGDGINDAPALANATIGVAMGSGTDIAIEAADVILVKDDISSIRYAIELSRRLRRIVIQNIIFSFAVIILLVISNFMSKVSLPLGVVGHEGSTILVILNSLRLLRANKS